MSDALADVELELHEATARARALIETTDGRLFTVRPTPADWSAAECLAHLSISTEEFLPVLRQSIDDVKARGLRSDAPPKMDLLGRVLRWFLEPPIRSKVKTAARFVPRSTRARAEALAEFEGLQTRLGELITASRGLDLRKAKIVSPFDKRVKYNLFSAFRILVAHQRRHLWQAEQAVAMLRGGRAHA